jgi:hypothetical protein
MEENIIVVEKLCLALQQSENPTNLGISIALKVLLDENINLSERAEDLSKNITIYKEGNRRVIQRNIDLATENTQLKSANDILTIEIEQANALLKLYKSSQPTITQRYGRGMRTQLTWAEVGKKGKTTSKPVQTSIEFPVDSSPKATPVNDVEKSVYYKAAIKRAKKIWAIAIKRSVNPIYSNTHFVKSISTIIFRDRFADLKDAANITYNHIELCCLPIKDGGLGIEVGIRLEKEAELYLKQLSM